MGGGHRPSYSALRCLSGLPPAAHITRALASVGCPPLRWLGSPTITRAQLGSPAGPPCNLGCVPRRGLSGGTLAQILFDSTYLRSRVGGAFIPCWCMQVPGAENTSGRRLTSPQRSVVISSDVLQGARSSTGQVSKYRLQASGAGFLCRIGCLTDRV